MFRIPVTEDAVHQFSRHELNRVIERCTKAIKSHKATSYEYELYILAVHEKERRDSPEITKNPNKAHHVSEIRD